MFLHLGSDRVLLIHDGVTQELPRFGLEKTLGPALVDWYRRTPFSKVVVLNGPSGFTTLRVGTLSVNMLVHLLHQEKKHLEVYSCDKMTLYTYLVKKGFLPACGLLYLGQKKGVWLVNFDGNAPSVVDKQELVTQLHDREFFYDEVAEEGYWSELALLSGGSELRVRGDDTPYEVSYRDQVIRISFEDLGLSPQVLLEPAYSAAAI